MVDDDSKTEARVAVRFTRQKRGAGMCWQR